MAQSRNYIWVYSLVLLGICFVAWGEVVSFTSPRPSASAAAPYGEGEGRNGLVTFASAPQSLSASAAAPIGEGEKRNCLLKTAKSQLHVREVGSNRGKEVEKYLASCGLKAPQPYCGAFLKWCFDQCQIKLDVVFPARSMNWFTDRKRLVWKLGRPLSPQAPQAGDVVGFDFWRTDKTFRITHVELVWEWDDDDEVDEFYTIGANTSAPRGVLNPKEGVHLKERDKDRAVVAKWL